ncbi:uncharacterized protein LOC121833018 [Ixodes scapularis]|uniref:uncharacterized protein LOC121833018 n=1 Tax=Ixodes scapularis TaxID=6945 RepID=UPI001C382ABB|nr:uncharacterized protein LOC121833018 [Ixodes scapularis]
MSSATTQSKKRTSVYCCVYDCHNSYGNTAKKLPVVEFYRFPAKPYEAERRRKWVAAVRRALFALHDTELFLAGTVRHCIFVYSGDGDSWEPANGQARICSCHFVGNKKSSIAQRPAYIPTIFPSSYKARCNVTTETQLQRYAM